MLERTQTNTERWAGSRTLSEMLGATGGADRYREQWQIQRTRATVEAGQDVSNSASWTVGRWTGCEKD